MTIHSFSETGTDEIIREASERMGFISDDINRCKTFIANYTQINKISNWETMRLSTALAAAAVDAAYVDLQAFDGRYLYYSPSYARSFLRFDTTLAFTNSSAWEKMSTSTAMGGSGLDASYYGSIFDGRYIYYAPYNSYTYIRLDTEGTYTSATYWEKINCSTAQGGSFQSGACLSGSFDGRYVYYVSHNSKTFIRFDTTKLFTDGGSWERISVSTAQGSSTMVATYCGGTFDGRYIYYVPYYSDTFLRFDTTLAFTNSSAWEKISMSTVQGSSPLDDAYASVVFDGRYVHFTGFTSVTLIRFDTTKSFTHSSSWERMSLSTAIGNSSNSLLLGMNFDGRYIYYNTYSSISIMRFDTTQTFLNSSSWEKVSLSTILGASPTFFGWGVGFDGKYMYFQPYNSDTLVRCLATNSNIGRR